MALYYLKHVTCAAGCPSSDEHKLFRFPTVESRYLKWAEIAQLPIGPCNKWLKNRYLCARHFDSRQFKDKYRFLLIRGAMPSITREDFEKSLGPLNIPAKESHADFTMSTSPKSSHDGPTTLAPATDAQSQRPEQSEGAHSVGDSPPREEHLLFTDLFPLSFSSVQSDDAVGARWGGVDSRGEAPCTRGAATPPAPTTHSTPASRQRIKGVSLGRGEVPHPPGPPCRSPRVGHFGEVRALSALSRERRVGDPIGPIDSHYRYNLCRLCFQTRKEFVNIFEGQNMYGFAIKDAIEDLLHFQVSNADGYPQQACRSCILKLLEFKKFKDQCMKDRESFERELKRLQFSNHGNPVISSQECAAQESGEGHSMAGAECQGEEDQCPRSIVMDSEGFATLKEGCGAGREEGGIASEGEEGGGVGGCTVMDFVEVRLAESGGEARCRECGHTFECQDQLREHAKEHESSRPLPCLYCGKRFKSLNDLNAHIVVHSDYKPFECEHCGLRCRSKHMMARHKRTHSALKPFLCSVCGKTYADALAFRRHVLKSHSKRKPLGCGECGEEFESASSLANHSRSRHTGERPFVCEDCGKAFASRHSLRQHSAKLHSTALTKKFQCRVCDKSFSSKPRVVYHVQRSHKMMADALIVAE
ncbi:uncharacterized protein [Hetaerina americana]|uniref:uncharacterized protein n=1 Tax=Hetaerina americana TaxID=62018 RepID=UPI003A7F20F4